MNKPGLPIGIQSFKELRTGGYVYADKTSFIDQLLAGKYYFLSRPRRFGKSLLVDTLDCLFSGKKELFQGLFIEDKWDWSETNPVLRIDFAGGDLRSHESVLNRLHLLLSNWSKLYNIDIDPSGNTSPGDKLLSFVPALASIKGKVVILVDEYDKPILDNLEKPEVAREMRDILKDFYGSIKPLDEHLRFVFLTGVSKFAKTGIFSGLNNLNDITIDTKYSALCGYTQENLETVFAEYLKNFDTEQVRDWYNGYTWAGETVYNPFDILLLFDKGVFRSYWFETGTPSFLVKLFQQNPVTLPELEGLTITEDYIGSFDIANLKLETLLYQTGYLTIKEQLQAGNQIFYKLGFPNLEVKSSYSRLILGQVAPERGVTGKQLELDKIMESGNGEALKNWLFSFMASIPHDWYRKNPIADYEGYYSSLIYALFASLGYDVIPEDTTNKGRVDMTVKHKRGIWIFEIKVEGVDRSGSRHPLEQIKERGYADKYSSSGLPVFLIGLIFNKKTRDLESWEMEEVKG